MADLAEHKPSLYMTKLSVQAFRNYADAWLDFDERPVILTGRNGSGKTNLLEAISLFVPGRGLRRAKLSDLQNNKDSRPWGVAATLATAFGDLKIGTGKDTEKAASAKRLIHIDGQPVKSQQKLSDHVSIIWVTPEMDRVLTESPAARRRLLDKMVFDADPAHAGRMARYERALRERLRLLREGSRDNAWLTALESDMADTGIAIVAARTALLGQLEETMAEASSHFPKALLAWQGMIERKLESEPALLVEDFMRAALKENRSEDARTGSCAIGPHRSDLIVLHAKDKKNIYLCSTGEQKALTIALMLAYARLEKKRTQRSPLLLLDDIAAHLDEDRRDALFDEIKDLAVQAWITGTDAAFFQNNLKTVQHIKVDRGVLSYATD